VSVSGVALAGARPDRRDCDMSASTWEEEEWFYVLNKAQQGPATIADLAALLAKGRSGGGISGDTLVWCSALTEWTRLKEVSALMGLLQQPAPEPASTPTPAPAVPPPPQAPTFPNVPAAVQSPMRSMPAPTPAPVPSPKLSSSASSGCAVGGSHASAASGTASAASVAAVADGTKKHGAIRSFLLGWLPQRSAPKDLVRRGILHDDPSGAPGGRGVKADAPPRGDELFGGTFATHLKRPDTSGGIPLVLEVLMARLRSNHADGLRSEGIFRIPGDSGEMQLLRTQINKGADVRQVVDGCQNVHSAAGLLKMYFRELKPPLLSFGLYEDFVRCSKEIGAPSPSADVSGLVRLLPRLPAGHFELLQHLIAFMVEVTSYASESKMSVGNVAAVFAPNLLRPEVDSIEHLADTGHVVNVIAVFIACYAKIFGVPEPASAASSESLAGRLSHASSAGAPQAHAGSLAGTSAASLTEPEAEPEARWFYLNEEHEQHGPVDWASLQALFREARITSSTFVFSDGMADWKPVVELGDINGREPL